MKNSNGDQNKIELLSCHLNSQRCNHHLKEINRSYSLAHNYHLEKDYFNSIRSLKSAFKIAEELKETTCLNCASFFQSTLTESLENINSELKRMSTGLFAKKRYRSSYIESCNILNEIRNTN